MHQRDDIYEYSLDTHHDEAHGRKMRMKFYMVLGILSLVTIVEVIMGLLLEPSTFLTTSFIVLTLVKAGYIVYVFMHLGDEKKNMRASILFPFIVLIGYLIYIALAEAVYTKENRAPVMDEKIIPVHTDHHGDDAHATEEHSDEGHGDSHGGH